MLCQSSSYAKGPNDQNRLGGSIYATRHQGRNLATTASLMLTPYPGAVGTRTMLSESIGNDSFVNSQRSGDSLVEYSWISSRQCIPDHVDRGMKCAEPRQCSQQWIEYAAVLPRHAA
jgi:hypothetical protein